VRAVWYDRTGAAEDVLTVGDMPTPDPGPGEVLVRLRASGVNPSDVKARAGSRGGASGMPWPRVVPHSDGAGVVASVGEGVDAGLTGRRVWVWNAQWGRPFGTAAEYVALPAAQTVPLPEGVGFATGAALGIPAMTAAHCAPGDGEGAGRVALIAGGAGTVGLLAVRFAKRSGAFVVATARGEADMARAAAAGADAVVDYAAPDLAERILAATGGRPADWIAEVEFGLNADVDAAVIAPRGRIVAYGSAGALRPALPFYPLLFKGVTLDFALIYLLTERERARAVARVNAALTEGWLDVPLHPPFALDDCAAAHRAVETGARSGAVTLEIP
jgi:NADPH2:quinone reductase